jgi:hypothetical protein
VRPSIAGIKRVADGTCSRMARRKNDINTFLSPSRLLLPSAGREMKEERS